MLLIGTTQPNLVEIKPSRLPFVTATPDMLIAIVMGVPWSEAELEFKKERQHGAQTRWSLREKQPGALSKLRQHVYVYEVENERDFRHYPPGIFGPMEYAGPQAKISLRARIPDALSEIQRLGVRIAPHERKHA